MSYDKSHSCHECDKCLKNVGKENLKKLPFLYMDKNDNMHEDVSKYFSLKEPGYRLYSVCKSCYESEIERWKKKH